MAHKAGFVNIIGNPNAGKSTLMNALLGEKLSIITYKAQTTRHRIMGIANSDDFQIVYSDTPGIVSNPAYKLHQSMMSFVNEALGDADIFLLVVDLADKKPIEQKAIERIKKSKTPVIVVLNKTDLADTPRQMAAAQHWQKELPSAEIVPVSALKRKNIDRVFGLIMNSLPEHPPYFDKSELSNRTLRFFVSEIVREKIFLFYEQEIPYSSEVIIEEYQEGEKLDRIRAVIIVERESQKAIIIGNQGSGIKKLGTEARKDIEEFTGKKVFLELFVKVDKDWRNNEGKLKHLGY
ncbi:MAG: GTPase Era [Bacteroidota bacterium]